MSSSCIFCILICFCYFIADINHSLPSLYLSRTELFWQKRTPEIRVWELLMKMFPLVNKTTVTVVIGCLQIWSGKFFISSKICVLNFGPEKRIYFYPS
jgi:hypothetical protein